MGPEPAASLPVLTFSPDQRAEHKCGKETDERVEETWLAPLNAEYLGEFRGASSSGQSRNNLFRRVNGARLEILSMGNPDQTIRDALRKAQAVLAGYLAPGGTNDQQTVKQLFGILNERAVIEALQQTERLGQLEAEAADRPFYP